VQNPEQPPLIPEQTSDNHPAIVAAELVIKMRFIGL
jgi:hypothetical protein